MRITILLMGILMVTAHSVMAKMPANGALHQEVPANADTLVITQLDGTRIHIVGFGNMYLAYSETIDGFTVVRNNEGMYEYARVTDEGNLVPDGVQAHDPDDREEEEIKYLNTIEKHLRYQSPTLEKLKNKKDQFLHYHRKKEEGRE